MEYKLFDLNNYGDELGALIPIEVGNNSPFEVKRIFYIYDTKPHVKRGCHANKNSKFIMIMISGSCKVKIDDGKTTEEITLNSPKQALYLDKMLWKEMYDFSYNAILLVLSNEHYDENEYIRNYDDFLKIVN